MQLDRSWMEVIQWYQCCVRTLRQDDRPEAVAKLGPEVFLGAVLQRQKSNLYHIPWTWCSYVRFNMWLHFVLILFHSASPVSRQHRQQVQAIRHASLKIRNRGPGIAVKEVNIYRVHTVHPSLFLRTTPLQWEACISWSLKLSRPLLVQKTVSWKSVIHIIYTYIIHILFMSTSQSGLRQCFVMLDNSNKTTLCITCSSHEVGMSHPDWFGFWHPRSACVATFLLPSGKCQ